MNVGSKTAQYFIYGLMDTSRTINDPIFSHVPIYIGRGIRKSRPYSHIRRALNGDTKCRIRAKIKQLIDNGIEIRPIIIKQYLSRIDADNLEIDLILKFKKIDDGGLLYNICDGGEGGDTFTLNPNKEAIRLKLQGRTPWNKGLTKTTDNRLKIISHITKNNIAKGIVKVGNNKGKRASIETKTKQRNSKLGIKLNVIRKDCIRFDIIDHEKVVNTFFGIPKTKLYLKSIGKTLYGLEHNKYDGWKLIITRPQH